MQNKTRAASRAAGRREQGSCSSSPRGVIVACVAMNCGPKINKGDEDEFPMSLFTRTQQ
jgi:hypothetical protein